MTEPVTLIPLTPALARALLAGTSTARLASGFPRDDDQYVLDAHAQTDESNPYTFLICVQGLVVGTCGAKSGPDQDGQVEIGYGLVAGWWGRGVGTEAVAQLLEVLATDGALRRVRAAVAVGNLASRRLLQRLGFEPGDYSSGSEVGYLLELHNP